MLDPRTFRKALEERGIRFFVGVPDSLLKDFCLELETLPQGKHIVAANEGNAVALAAGWHAATGEAGLVYLQNSGLGNTINPLISLADPAVYGIPMLLLVGWRGEPDTPDEPQHLRQGAVMLSLLDTLGIPYEILPSDEEDTHRKMDELLARMRQESRPVALVARKGIFATCLSAPERADAGTLSREEALEATLKAVGNAHIVATTGMLSRELFELREKRGEPHDKDFLTVGSMGHASQIALGVAIAHPELPVYCFDGDGALLMHLGGLTTIGNAKSRNFKHIVFNNEAHDSVGGQPTAAVTSDLPALAGAAGYSSVASADTHKSLVARLAELRDAPGPAFLEIKVRRGARADLGRPTETPQESLDSFKRSF